MWEPERWGGDGGAAAKAQIAEPFFCVYDRAGNLFVAEVGNHTVRRVDARTGVIATIAGAPGKPGFGGDNGPGTSAPLHEPVSLAVEPLTGDVFIADRLNCRVRRWSAKTAIITTVAGDGVKAFGGDNGSGPKAQFKEPHDVCLDGRGGLLIADVADNRVRRLDLKTGIVTTWAGNGERTRNTGGPIARATWAGPRAIAVSPRDNAVFVCEREGNAISRVDAQTGIVSPYAGTGQKGYDGDNGQALRATFNGPKALGCDSAGNLYIVDTENHAIRCVDARTGAITTIVGGRKGPSGDGCLATLAGLDRPHGVCFAPDGALLIADTNNHRIRRVEKV